MDTLGPLTTPVAETLADLGDRRAVERILVAEFGTEEGRRAFHRWRLFFLACAELFGFRHGQEWLVSHYLFERP